MSRLFTRESSGKAPGMVRRLIYSGRPNPEWHLSPAEQTELKRRLGDTIGRKPTAAPDLPASGYQGFLVFVDDTNRLDDPSFLVYSHAMIERPGERSRAWEDVTGLEAWLLEEASRRGYDKQLHALGIH